MSPSKDTLGMEHIRILSLMIPFDPFNREQTVTIPQIDNATLLDLSISLYGEANTILPAADMGVPPDDVHLIVRANVLGKTVQHDVTESVVAVLQKLLDQENQSQLHDEMEEGLKFVIEQISSLPPALSPSPSDLQQARDSIQRMLGSKPLSRNLNRLGDRSSGLHGNLHMFTQVYSWISLQPISLNQVFAHFKSKTGTDLNLQTAKHLRLILAHGSSARFAQRTTGPMPTPSGRLNLTIECTFHNPLIDEVVDLENETRQRLTQIRYALSGDGPIQKAISKIRDDLINTVSQLGDVRRAVDEHKLGIDSIQRTVDAVKNKVDRIS